MSRDSFFGEIDDKPNKLNVHQILRKVSSFNFDNKREIVLILNYELSVNQTAKYVTKKFKESKIDDVNDDSKFDHLELILDNKNKIIIYAKYSTSGYKITAQHIREL